MSRPIAKIVPLGATMLLLLIASMAVRTARYEPARADVAPAQAVSIPEGAAARLAGSLRIPTISTESGRTSDPKSFQALHQYLEAAFPHAHSQLERETVNTHSLLYTWRGTDPTLKPILLVGHLDVVPIEPGTESSWTEEPFSGRVSDGYIWGRGAIDNKSAVLGLLEAVEMLLRDGFRPARTVYLAYGHDEEVGGAQGGKQIAALLQDRGVELEMILDEGGVITDGVLSGVSKPVALVGIAEKGFVSVELTVRQAGGHSSMPPPQSSVGILSAAIARLEQNQMPARLEQPTRQLFERIGSQFPFAQRAVFANLWLTRPLLLGKLEGSPTTNAMVRTTTAATIFQAGEKENVMPSHARAVVNFRILPGDSVTDVVDHARRVINDSRVEVRVAAGFSAEPSAVSSAESVSFRKLERAIRSTNPDAIVAPYLVVVVTDSRHYANLTSNTFRFQPLRVSPDDLERLHGSNERVAVSEYERAIGVYRRTLVEVTE
jgi:carboxypeptidase PM20D1